MQLNQLSHLKKEMQVIQAISDYTTCRLRRAKQKKRMTYKSEHDRLIGELSHTTITPGTRDRLERRKRGIKAAYQGSQYTQNILLLVYIQNARHIRNQLQRGQTPTYIRRAFYF